VQKLIAGRYAIQSKGESPNYASEQGDFFRILMIHDLITNSESNRNYKSKSWLQEQGDSIPQLVEIDGFNLPTLFGDTEDLTNHEFDVDD